jgi:hypothetical protein
VQQKRQESTAGLLALLPSHLGGVVVVRTVHLEGKTPKSKQLLSPLTTAALSPPPTRPTPTTVPSSKVLSLLAILLLSSYNHLLLFFSAVTLL